MAEPQEDEVAPEEEAPKKRSKLPLILGLVLALAGGGGGFFAVQSGLLFGSGEAHVADEHAAEPELGELPDVTFLPVDPLIISLGPNAKKDHLRFRAQLEVATKYAADVQSIMPRVVDVLNSYLRAISLDDVQDPGALMKLRAQMLRRVQIVTGEGRVNDLLVMEFVLN